MKLQELLSLLRFPLKSTCRCSGHSFALEQRSEKCIIEQFNHHMYPWSFPSPRRSLPSAPSFLSCPILLHITINLLLFPILADTFSPVLTPGPLFSPPPPGPHPSLGAMWSFWEWLLLLGGWNIKKSCVADEAGGGGGVREAVQTLGASLVQAKQSDSRILLKRSHHSPQYHNSEEVRGQPIT